MITTNQKPLLIWLYQLIEILVSSSFCQANYLIILILVNLPKSNMNLLNCYIQMENYFYWLIRIFDNLMRFDRQQFFFFVVNLCNVLIQIILVETNTQFCVNQNKEANMALCTKGNPLIQMKAFEKITMRHNLILLCAVPQCPNF